MRYKKGQVTLQNGPGLLISLAIVALFAGTMLLALRGLYNGTPAEQGAGGDSNSTFTALKAVAVNFATGEYPTATACTNAYLFNASGVATTANFTISGCLATWNGGAEANNTGHTASYNFTYDKYDGNTAHTQLNNTALGIGNITGQMPTVGTMISIALVLGIVFMVFMFKPNFGGGL